MRRGSGQRTASPSPSSSSSVARGVCGAWKKNAVTRRTVMSGLRARSFDAKTDLARARYRPSLRLDERRVGGRVSAVARWAGASTHRDHRVQVVLVLGGRGVLGDARRVRVRARPRGDARARGREDVALSHLSRDCARRNNERVGFGADGTGRGDGQRARVFESSASTRRSLARHASRRLARSRDARGPGPGQVPSNRFRSRASKYSKKPRRRSGRRRTRGDPEARADSGRGPRSRGDARALVRREDASRRRARPRGRARSGRGGRQRANGTERDGHRGG